MKYKTFSLSSLPSYQLCGEAIGGPPRPALAWGKDHNQVFWLKDGGDFMLMVSLAIEPEVSNIFAEVEGVGFSSISEGLSSSIVVAICDCNVN